MCIRDSFFVFNRFGHQGSHEYFLRNQPWQYQTPSLDKGYKPALLLTDLRPEGPPNLIDKGNIRKGDLFAMTAILNEYFEPSFVLQFVTRAITE